MVQVKCITLADIDLSLECSDRDNMGGTAPFVIFGYHNEVDVWPDMPAADGATLESAGALVGDVVMKQGCKAYKFEFQDGTSEFKITEQGEPGGKSFLYDFTFIAPKLRKKILGFANAVKDQKMFLIVKDNNGKLYLMGDADRGAMRAEDDGMTTGAGPTARNQATFKFQYTSPKALEYEGDVENILVATAAG